MKILSKTLVPLDMAVLSCVVARIGLRTGEDDEPNHINTVAGTSSYKEI